MKKKRIQNNWKGGERNGHGYPSENGLETKEKRMQKNKEKNLTKIQIMTNIEKQEKELTPAEVIKNCGENAVKTTEENCTRVTIQ